ncbi:MAG: hypothetical protein J6386_05215 [Candidatus Synoicihabitans palmerolidicus]|nr:hypothetical protein [Candidatus Synoicihabitans palmerolidicus]
MIRRTPRERSIWTPALIGLGLGIFVDAGLNLHGYGIFIGLSLAALVCLTRERRRPIN